MILHQVTIGSDSASDEHLDIGSGVCIYTGAKVLMVRR